MTFVIIFRFITKKHFRKEGPMWVANSKDFIEPQVYRFQIQEPEQMVVTNSDDGDEIIIDAILADTTPRKGDGRWFTPDALQAIADQINSLAKEKGMFRKIKAAVKDGKLWIKAWLDARYREIIQLYKFLSIEALANPMPDGSLEDPDYLGFTFSDKPRLPDAQIAGL